MTDNLTGTLQQPKDNHLACGAAPALAFAYAAKITFVDLYLANRKRRLVGQLSAISSRSLW